VSAVAEEHFEDGRAAEGGPLKDVGRRGGWEAKFFGEGGDIGDSLLFADVADGGFDGTEALAHFAGDLEIGPAEAEAGEDFFADGGLAMELAGAAVLSLGEE